jgi:hypothetical protein
VTTRFQVSVFSGSFDTEASAMAYAEYHYPPEDPTVPDDEWNEDPTCPLAEAIGADFSPEYRETIWGSRRYEYLKTLLVDHADVERVRDASADGDNVLFLIFEIGENKGLDFRENSAGLRACGRFKGQWEH